MNAAGAMLRRGLGALRHSMTAQISLSITLVSVLIIALFGTMIDQFLRQERREENDVLLTANLAFIRDDLAAAGWDPAKAQQLVDLAERRVHRLHVAILDERGGKAIARSANYPVPVSETPPPLFDSGSLPVGMAAADFEPFSEGKGPPTSIWVAPNGYRYRMLVGRIEPPAASRPDAAPLLVSLAIETVNTPRRRMDDRLKLAATLAVAAALACLFGIWIARRILASARRLGAQASRIGAQALHERLSLEHTPSELVESTVAINHMLDRLQRAFERLSAFSSDLAHDLRTPIGNLLGEAQVALSRPRSSDEYRAVLESSVEEYERLSRMIGNMLFLARADNAKAPLAARWLEPDAALERVVGYFELLAEERGIVVEKELRAQPGVPARVWADETMLVRALSNLVSNALRYGPRGSRIRLLASIGEDGACTLEVSNEGPAIAAEHQPHIFERFYRVDASRQGSASGSGLGLAIVRSIMEMHGGTASVDSAPGRRTVFTLRFPAPPAAA